MSLESSTYSGACDESLAGLEDLRPALLGDAPAAQIVALDPRLRGDESLGQLGLGHLEREQHHRVAAQRRVLGDVGDQRRLAHRRPRGDDDQVARLKAAGLLVEVLEARRRAGQRRLGDRQPVQLVGLLVEDVGDRPDLLLAVVVGDLEHRSLGALDQVARRRLARQHARLDLVRRGQQRAHLRVVADDPPVLARVAGRRHPAGQLVDRLGAADLLELAALAQRLGDRQVVDLAVALVQLDHRREHRAVLLAVEVLGPQMLLDQQRVQVPLVEQHRTEDRLLGLEVVRRDGDGLDGAHRRRSILGRGRDGMHERSRKDARKLSAVPRELGEPGVSEAGARRRRPWS